MKALLAGVVVLLCGLLWLRHEVRAPAELPRSDRRAAAPAHRDDRGAGAASRSFAPATAATTTAPPPGGVRPWSPTASPTDGPDPFAPVAQVRTLDDTRAGLTD